MASEIWKEEYKRKCMDISAAMSLIENNDLVSLAVLTPGELSAALHTRSTELEQLHIRTTVTVTRGQGRPWQQSR